MQVNQIYQMDGIEGMRSLPDKSVDLIVCDLPYGVTQNLWDTPLPFNELWDEYHRIIKDRGVIALTATMRFASELIRTTTVPFRYDLVWHKNKPTGFLNANRQPLRQHENILIFYKNQPVYHPQKTEGHAPVNSYTKRTSDGPNYGSTKRGIKGGGQTDRHPTSVLPIAVLNNDNPEKVHSTQKPAELYEWLIRSYTNPGDLVLDNCIGSGTAAVACLNTGRSFIGFELDPDFAVVANERIRRHRESMEA